jgi:cellulose biosynthesis protein BcsQ
VEARCLTLVGLAGTGKSTIAAALARPEVTEGEVPEDFVQALAFISEVTTSAELARVLQQQLRVSVAGFSDAGALLEGRLTREDREQLDALQLMVLGPLSQLDAGPPVRIVIDGLDQLPAGAAIPVQSVLAKLRWLKSSTV